jgi:hypothetical protein
MKYIAILVVILVLVYFYKSSQSVPAKNTNRGTGSSTSGGSSGATTGGNSAGIGDRNPSYTDNYSSPGFTGASGSNGSFSAETAFLRKI